MKPLITRAIVLSRTDFGEADRIVAVVTPDRGKLRLMARGVRKPRSKLAGGIELFSVSEITFIKGRGEISTLISARLNKHYGNIVRDITRVQLGYDLIKTLNRATEDETDQEYYDLLEAGFKALDDHDIVPDLIRAWFNAQLLRHAGHTPNLQTDSAGHRLEADKTYLFDFDDMTFSHHPDGQFAADHIKLLRLIFSGPSPQLLNQVQNLDDLLPAVTPLVQNMLRTHIRT